MMPEDSGIGKLAVPSEFQITYMYRDKENSYIPKISRCVLKDLTVDYAPNQQFHTFKQDEKGAAPIAMKLALEFGELEIRLRRPVMVVKLLHYVPRLTYVRDTLGTDEEQLYNKQNKHSKHNNIDTSNSRF